MLDTADENDPDFAVKGDTVSAMEPCATDPYFESWERLRGFRTTERKRSGFGRI